MGRVSNATAVPTKPVGRPAPIANIEVASLDFSFLNLSKLEPLKLRSAVLLGSVGATELVKILDSNFRVIKIQLDLFPSLLKSYAFISPAVLLPAEQLFTH